MEPDAKDARKFADAGPLHIDGRINDGVKYVADGHKGYALRFSGAGEDTARVDNPKLINRAGAPISVTMWIKPEAWSDRAAFTALLTKTTEAWIGKPFAFAIGDNGNLGFDGPNGGGYSEPLLKMGEWQHVAVTFQAGGDRILYINGKEVSRTAAGPDLQDNEEPLIFGAEHGYNGPGGNRSKYKGLMDEAAIYAAALTPEQILLDMYDKLQTRAATLADFAPRKQNVHLSLVRADMPTGNMPRNGHTRQTAQRRSGPDAVDWPEMKLKIGANQTQTLWKNGAEETAVLPCREGNEGRAMFQREDDAVIAPGNHWIRAFKWVMWGRRFVHTTDSAVRMDGTNYDLWTFPVKIAGPGQADIKSVILKCEGETIFTRNEALHSLTLLLPQNVPGKPYEIRVNGAAPFTFNVGLKPVTLGSPKDGFQTFAQTIEANGAKITIATVDSPETFPNPNEWNEDEAAIAQGMAYVAAQKNANKEGVPLVADYKMEPDAATGGTLVDAGALGFNGKLRDGAEFVDGGHHGKALKLAGGKARAEVSNPALDSLTRNVSFTAWIKADALPNADSAQIVTKRPGWWTGKPFSLDVNRDGTIGFSGNDGTWEPNMRGADSAKIKVGEWAHVAFSYQAGGEEVLYLNGKAVASRRANRPLSGNKEALIFGFEQGGDFNGGRTVGFQGLIDDAHLYDAALTAEQIQADMAGTLKTRAVLAGSNPVPETFVMKPETDWTKRVGAEVPRSPEQFYVMSLTHGMSGGFKYYAEQGPRFNGDMEPYAKYLAGLNIDTDFEQSNDGVINNSTDPNSFEHWMAALAKNGVKGGLNNVSLNDADQSLYSYTLADFHAPKYRDAQLLAQRFARFPNFIGETMGADNAAYTWYWDWAGPEPTKFWGESVALLVNGGKNAGDKKIATPRAPGMPPDKAHEVAAKTNADYLDYINKFDEAFRQYGYLAGGVWEVSPNLMLTTGSFGSSPGVGSSGGYSWATAPGKPMFEGLPVLQAYDWNESSSSKPMHNEALTDRLRSWYPNKPAWALLDNFGLFFRREPMQRQFALALTRGVKAVGTQFFPIPENTADKPGVTDAYREIGAWVRKYGGAYAMTEPAPTVGILFVEGQAVSRANSYSERGPQEGKTTEALFICHAAGWPAKIITPEEIKRGLPPSMKAILLVGLNKIDDSWHWHDGLTDDLTKFTAGGGRLITDDESVSPIPATSSGMTVFAYASQSDTDNAPLLFRRNSANIEKLRKAMQGISAPMASSTEPTVWAVPTVAGDVQYVTAVNWGYEDGKNASQYMKPQIGQLTWNTNRPIYDVRLRRRITPEEAANCDLTKDGFRYYALPPSVIKTPGIRVSPDPYGYLTAYVTANSVTGIPVEITITKGGETATVYSATGLGAKLPLKISDAPGAYQIKATELLSGLTAEITTRTGVKGMMPGEIRAIWHPGDELLIFAARKTVPLTIALTPKQAENPQIMALAKKLAAFYESKGRTAQMGRIEPGGVVVSLQPLQAAQTYPRWKTVDADLVLLGAPTDNLLLLDEARGFLLPAEALNVPAGQASVSLAYSPFVGERQVINIVANDAAGLQAGVSRLIGVKRESAAR